MAKDYDKEDGVWRTIGGRKVFIRKGQNLADAMIESGKFKGQKNKPGMRESYRKEKEKDIQEQKDLAKKFQESETDKDYYAFLNKVEDNGEKYDKTLEERIKEKQRNDEIDKQRGTEPLREQYRQEGQEDLERKQGWLNYRNRYQESINRSTNPDNRKKYVEERDMAEKYYNDARNNLNQKAEKLLSQKDKSTNEKSLEQQYADDLHNGKTKGTFQQWRDKRNGKEPTTQEEINNLERIGERKPTNEKARKDAFDYSREEVTKAYETMREKMQKHMNNNEDHWSGKEYTNAEFLAHLEDANWHGEMKQLREANLTPEQLTEIKDKTTLSSWGVGSELTGKENVQKMIDSVKNKSTNETMNNAIREKASKNNTIPRDYEKITYTQKIDTNAGKKGDKFELYKDENGQTHTKNLRTGETYQANMSMMKSPEAVEINDVVKKQTSNKYEGTKRWGFGYANDDNVPVYNNKIDYTGDFTHANLQTLSDSELKEALNKQTELLNKANAEKVGDRRTRNGRMQAIFNKSEKLQYNNGVNKIKEELVRRQNEKYPQYKGTPYEVKYYSLEDVMKDKDSPLNQYIRNKANEKKAYKQYLKEHPESKMSLKEFRSMNK